MRPVTSRRGFTLLEVILALAVGVLLLGALYVSVDVQLRHARVGRDIVEKATLARSLLARIDADIAATATLVDPERYRIANKLVATTSGFSTIGSGGTGGSGSSSTTPPVAATTPNIGLTGTGGSSSSTASTTSSSSSSGTTDAIVLPLSVQGDSTTLNLFIARVPREALPTDPNVTPPIVSDLRRVSWWLPAGGLARQEIAVSTSQDALDNLPPGISDEDSFIIAPEVQNIQFQYFDGTDWQDTWDCTTVGNDGVTPIGAPAAIAIVIDIANPQEGAKNDDDTPTKRYRHVVACRTANGITPQQQNAAGGGTGQ